MGRQQSFVSFISEKKLVEQVKEYMQRDKKHDQVHLLTLTRVLKDTHPFRKGEIIAVIGGDRGYQRSIKEVGLETGFSYLNKLAFIDNTMYCQVAFEQGQELGEFLDERFKALTDKEIDELLGVQANELN